MAAIWSALHYQAGPEEGSITVVIKTSRLFLQPQLLQPSRFSTGSKHPSWVPPGYRIKQRDERGCMSVACSALAQHTQHFSFSHFSWPGLQLHKSTISTSHQLQQCCLGKIGNKEAQRICQLEQLNYNGDPNRDRQRTAVESLQVLNALHAVLRATLLESGAAWMSGVAEGHFLHWSFSDRK